MRPMNFVKLAIEAGDKDTLTVVVDLYEEIFLELDEKFGIRPPDEWKNEHEEIIAVLDFYDNDEEWVLIQLANIPMSLAWVSTPLLPRKGLKYYSTN